MCRVQNKDAYSLIILDWNDKVLMPFEIDMACKLCNLYLTPLYTNANN
jgi:hypothetical protein